MGRFGGGRGQEFATAYSVQYWRSGRWHTYTNLTGHTVMTGNENTWEAAVQQLVPPIVASRVRVLPRSTHPRTVCMRLELHGCERSNSLPTSYKAPKGEAFSPRLPLRDLHDGGLGLLSDGMIGAPIDFSSSEGNGWVGWTRGQAPLLISFEFEQPPTLIGLHIVSYHKPDLSIKAPANVSASFTAALKTSSSSSITLTPTTSCSSIGPCLLSMPLPTPIIKAAKASLSLEFNSKWILISELHWQTDNQEEEGKEKEKKKMARKEELKEEKISVIKKA